MKNTFFSKIEFIFIIAFCIGFTSVASSFEDKSYYIEMFNQISIEINLGEKIQRDKWWNLYYKLPSLLDHMSDQVDKFAMIEDISELEHLMKCYKNEISRGDNCNIAGFEYWDIEIYQAAYSVVLGVLHEEPTRNSSTMASHTNNHPSFENFVAKLFEAYEKAQERYEVGVKSKNSSLVGQAYYIMELLRPCSTDGTEEDIPKTYHQVFIDLLKEDEIKRHKTELEDKERKAEMEYQQQLKQIEAEKQKTIQDYEYEKAEQQRNEERAKELKEAKTKKESEIEAYKNTHPKTTAKTKKSDSSKLSKQQVISLVKNHKTPKGTVEVALNNYYKQKGEWIVCKVGSSCQCPRSDVTSPENTEWIACYHSATWRVNGSKVYPLNGKAGTITDESVPPLSGYAEYSPGKTSSKGEAPTKRECAIDNALLSVPPDYSDEEAAAIVAKNFGISAEEVLQNNRKISSYQTKSGKVVCPH